MTTIPSRSESAAARALDRMARQAEAVSRYADGRTTQLKGWGSEEEAAARWRNVKAAASLRATSLKAASASLSRRKYACHAPKGIPWDAIAFLLGWYPERHVAEALGVTHSTVIHARRQRGWPAAHGRGRPRSWRDFEPFPGPHPRGWIPNLADRFQRAYATAEDGEGLAAVAAQVRAQQRGPDAAHVPQAPTAVHAVGADSSHTIPLCSHLQGDAPASGVGGAV